MTAPRIEGQADVHPILLLEINEVPWRLVDRYYDRAWLANVRRFFDMAQHFTTVAVDTGELSPWVTWPTLHRGMNNERHGIRDLGQDPSTFGGTPIWQQIRARGDSIGVFGSMQSWPPIEPGPGGFYVPDTFAHDEQCIPQHLSPVQAFNLSQVRDNPRVVKARTPVLRQAAGLLPAFVRAGVRPRTFAKLASQVVSERFDRRRANRRPVLQTVLMWDVFRRQFDAGSPPALSTFFTNHVAGVMHRYWRDVFPEDFGDPMNGPNEPLMQFALQVLDDMFADVNQWMAKNPGLIVVFASSMGQSAIHRPGHPGYELVVTDVNKLMAEAGLRTADYVPLLAMVPQVAVEIADADLRASVASRLAAAESSNGKNFIQVRETGTTLSISVLTPDGGVGDGSPVMGGRQASWEGLGITLQKVEPGTGYHVPEGVLAVACDAAPRPRNRGTGRPVVRADAVKEWLMDISEHGPTWFPRLASQESQTAASAPTVRV